MTYEFREVGGTKIIEKYFPAAEMPELGSVINVGGKKYMRILSGTVTFEDAKIKTERKGYNREDISLPRGNDLGHGLGPNGFPIIASKSHEREVMAKYGFKRD